MKAVIALASSRVSFVCGMSRWPAISPFPQALLKAVEFDARGKMPERGRAGMRARACHVQ
ncbi:MAG: hypothetical protein M5U33_11910 [Pseudorhodoplanes sp.]|nr:hypothetical protein [Pseudorhodoplanes sp.]